VSSVWRKSYLGTLWWLVTLEFSKKSWSVCDNSSCGASRLDGQSDLRLGTLDVFSLASNTSGHVVLQLHPLHNDLCTMLQIVASTFSHLNLVSRGRYVYIRTPNSKPAVADCATITALTTTNAAWNITNPFISTLLVQCYLYGAKTMKNAIQPVLHFSCLVIRVDTGGCLLFIVQHSAHLHYCQDGHKQ
jgi:hypothetical protein